MTYRWKIWLIAVAAGALLSLGGATTVQARPNRNCSAQIDRETQKLQREVWRFGVFSRQAQQRRQKIERLRRECGGFGFFGRDRDDRRWDRNGRDRDDRRGRNGRDNRYWDGRRWRRR